MNKFFNKKLLYVAGGTMVGMTLGGLGIKYLTGRVPYTKELVGLGLFGGGSFVVAQSNKVNIKRLATGVSATGGTIAGASLYKRAVGKSFPALENSGDTIT